MLKNRSNKLLAIANKLPVFKLLIPLYICIAVLFAVLIAHGDMQLLEPAGYIADIQTKILWGAIIFACIVGVTIITSFFVMVSRFKEGGHSRYEPEWHANMFVLSLGWGIPLLAITVISILVWQTARMVDPYQPISGTKPAVTVQVVALRWKWLFLYPNDRLATVNMMEIPAGTPINLQLTADAPMNSFWIPRLSGQIYAMTGMVTQLHIEADHTGTYQGSPAEMSGDGFAGMDFPVKVVSMHNYESWKSSVRSRYSEPLTYTSYTTLAQPSEYRPESFYTLPDPNLFNEIVMQFMAPGTTTSTLQVRGASL